MRHLNLVDLARLVDEAPAGQEAEHLEACSACRAELSALRLQTFELSQMADLAAPSGLDQRVRDVVLFEAAKRRRRVPSAGMLRAAAGALLFIGGAALGSLVKGPAAGVPAPVAVQAAPPTTLAEAAAAVSRAEAEYLRALTYYAELNENGEGLDPVNRLAALEGIVLTTRAALRDAPADPVINNYHLTAVGQRDALLRQIERLSTSDEWF